MRTKMCSKCKTEKDLANFNKHRATKDGKDSWCKDCKREDNRQRNRTPHRREYNKRLARTKAAKKQKKEYSQRPEVKKRRAAQMRRYMNDPRLRLRHEARWQIRHRVTSGEIIKPKHCSKCNDTKTIQAHHPDYSKPLEVIWVCLKCHLNLHALAEKEGSNGK